jgi:hypothetical protein
MITTDVSAGPEGFEHRAFECLRCGFKKVKITVEPAIGRIGCCYQRGCARFCFANRKDAVGAIPS